MMTTRVLVNGLDVTEVKPGTPMQLRTSGWESPWEKWLLLPSNVRYVVMDSQGDVKLDVPVAVNVLGDAWLNWVSPRVPGTYYFFGNYPDFPTVFTQFEVTSLALTPIPGGGGYIPPAPTPTPTPTPRDGGYMPPATPPGTGKLPGWALPAIIAAVALVFLLPEGKKK